MEEEKTKIGKLRIVLIVAIAVLCLLVSSSVLNCSGQKDALLNTTDTSGGVAATVNGVEIGENAITAYIENFRTTYGYDDDESWAEYLLDNGYTVDSLRGETLDYYVNQELLRQAADIEGVSVSNADLDASIEEYRSSYSDTQWQSMLESNGYSEASFREYTYLTLLQDALLEAIGQGVSASDDDVLDYVQMYASSYNGAKRICHILFDSADEATALSVLEQIEAGDISFEEAAVMYSIDESSAEQGGYVGWDKMATFNDDFQEVVDGLSEGEMSGVVSLDDGVHIILCSDVLTAPDTIESLDDVSEAFVEMVRSSVDLAEQQQAFNEYMLEFEEESEIVKNLLPDDVSYYVDLSLYENTEDEASTDDNTDAEDEETVDSDASTDTDDASED